MELGLRRLKEGFLLSLRLIREIHGRLLASGRGSSKQPGEFRHSQNWIGGTRPGNSRFVPPPPDLIIPCMGALEKFLHNDPVTTRPLLKAALAHVQFETIHPFLDGNGRLGRLLITLLLCAEGVLGQPLLYLSRHFKKHKEEYYRLLQQVRVDGDWEAWLRFFLEGVVETAENATTTARKLLTLFAEDRAALGGETSSVLRLHSHLERQPLTSIASAAAALGVSVPTATRAIRVLEQRRIVRQIIDKDYRKLYAYEAYMNILNESAA
jgi:Fic family protein